MATITFEIDPKRKVRIDNLLLQRGQTFEQFVEPWLADADTHMGHDPSDDPEDQAAKAAIFAKKATKADKERTEAKQAKAEASRLEAEALLEQTKPKKEK